MFFKLRQRTGMTLNAQWKIESQVLNATTATNDIATLTTVPAQITYSGSHLCHIKTAECRQSHAPLS